MIFLDVADICHLVRKHTMKHFFLDLFQMLEEDFRRWERFNKRPRLASYHADGVVELMPTDDGELFSFKYVNGHPGNPIQNKLNIFGFGSLTDMQTGYPLLITEMTLLTAIRTAAVSALSSRYMSKKDAKVLAMIGTGAQSEFMAIAQMQVRGIREIRYFDSAPQAMERFHNNMQSYGIQVSLSPCDSAYQAVQGADIVVTATATKGRNHVVEDEWIEDGVHIASIGGDSPGKTELPLELLNRSKIVIEYYPQTEKEGEIQAFPADIRQDRIYAELWELVVDSQKHRENNTEVSIFDAVGFSLEDFSILRLCHTLSHTYGIGQSLNLIPEIEDPKDLFGLLL